MTWQQSSLLSCNHFNSKWLKFQRRHFYNGFAFYRFRAQKSKVNHKNAQRHFAVLVASFSQLTAIENKPGTTQVGAISKAQSVKFSSTAPEKPKSWTELARQGGYFQIFYPFCRKLSKNLKGEKLVFRKKVPQCQKN